MTTTPDNESRLVVSTARVARFNYADGEAKPVTRDSVAAEVAQMILNGTADNISLENLHLLKTPRMIRIEIDADDRDPLATARFILEQAGVNTTPARVQTPSVTPIDNSPYQPGTSPTTSAVRWDVTDAQASVPLTREEISAKVSEMILQGGTDTIVLVGLDTLPVIQKDGRLAEDDSSKAVIDAEGNVVRQERGQTPLIIPIDESPYQQVEPDVSPRVAPPVYEFLSEAGFFGRNDDGKPVVTLHKDGSTSMTIFRNDPFPQDAIKRLAGAADFHVIVE